MKKKCKGCGKTKGIHWFGVHSENKDGRRSLCQDCENKRNEKYRRKKQAERNYYTQFSPINFY